LCSGQWDANILEHVGELELGEKVVEFGLLHAPVTGKIETQLGTCG
jgi:hypothetical protein